jgi:hypothetical protein
MTTHHTIILLIYILAGTFIWYKGYRNPFHTPPNLGIKYLTRLICPPIVLFFLCGSPKSSKYPEGVMTAWVFSIQFFGIGLLIQAIIFLLLRQNAMYRYMGLLVTIGLVYGYTYWLTKTNTYK